MTTTADAPQHIPWLDGWRGLAIALVLLEHFGGGLPTGRLGVEVFFVLSGFLIPKILFEDRVPLGTFYRRRAARILPVFYLYLLTLVGAALLASGRIDWSSVATTALFLRSYFGVHIWEDPLGIGNLWSLNVEEHAYMFLSLLALLAAKQRDERAARWLLTIALLVPPASHVYFHFFPERDGITPFYLRTEGAIFPLLASAATFLWLRAYRLQISERAALVLLVLTIAVAIVDVIGVARGGTAIKYLVLPVLLAFSVNALHLMPRVVRDLLSARWLVWLGACSYSIYLWHYPFYVLINSGAWPFGNAAALACALLVGTASFYWFERPMRAWLRGSASKVSNAATAPAT